MNGVHSSVARAADCRSAGPWLKSGCALFVSNQSTTTYFILLDQRRERASLSLSAGGVHPRPTWLGDVIYCSEAHRAQSTERKALGLLITGSNPNGGYIWFRNPYVTV